VGVFLKKTHFLVLIISLSLVSSSFPQEYTKDTAYKSASRNISAKKAELKKDLEQTYGKDPSSSADGVSSFRTKSGLCVNYEIVADKAPEVYRSYKLGPGDDLEILLERIGLEQETISYEITSDYIEKFGEMVYTKYRVKVGPTGNINVPLAGEIKVSYLSVKDCQSLLRERLRKYLIDPKVMVKVTVYASYSISVVGEVHKPGIYELKRPISLSEALALGGGINHDGSWTKIYIGRRGERSRTMNITEIWMKKGLDQEIVLDRDDVVLVPPKLWITWDRFEQLAAIILMLNEAYNIARYY